jgi:hypothetical protein
MHTLNKLRLLASKFEESPNTEKKRITEEPNTTFSCNTQKIKMAGCILSVWHDANKICRIAATTENKFRSSIAPCFQFWHGCVTIVK